MFFNILIISSDMTGHGHKSITEALLEQLTNYPEAEVKVVDGFSLGGNLGLKVGRMYGSITRTSRDTWKMIWDITVKYPSFFIELSELSIQERFKKLLNKMKPDAIIITHPSYNTAVTNILSKLKNKTPVFGIVADPVTIGPLWCNPNAAYTICPTEEAREYCLKNGVPEDRIRVFGFPVRERFNVPIDAQNYIPRFPMRFMIISGGEGSGNMRRLAILLLKNFDCRVSLLCGRNKLLKKALERTIGEKYKDRIDVLGFTEAVQDIMRESDIIFTRASPNTMMEAVMCNVPLVITGALPGQEEGNPAFAKKHGLGVVCTDPKRLKATVAELLANNCSKLLEIKKSQLSYRNPDSAKNIIDFIMKQKP